MPFQGAILALDLATTTGWAYRGADGSIRSSTVRFTAPKENGRGYTFIQFSRWLRRTIDGLETRPALIAYEQPHLRGAASFYLTGLAAMTEAQAHIAAAACIRVHSASVRKHALGKAPKGRELIKPAMIAAAKARGWSVRDDNEADVLWILDYVAATAVQE